MKVRFQKPRQGAPAKLLADAVVTFDDADAGGVEFHGYAVREGEGGEPWVAVPQRDYTVDGEKRYYNLVRDEVRESKMVDAFKGRILEEYRAWAG